MKWLLVFLVPVIGVSCQLGTPATAPPGMPLDPEHNPIAPEENLTHATTEAGNFAIIQ